jgi:cellulose biosynthesis protein BcsQ
MQVSHLSIELSIRNIHLMKLITYCSFKGGAGKTTALMAMCSALAARGLKIALFEADENRPLTKWKENAVENNTWDDNCDVFIADEIEALEVAYKGAEDRKFEYALIDTQGGSSELNNTIIASSDFLVLPTALTALDIDETLATYRYIVELLMVEKLETPSAILKQRVPVNKLTLSQKAADALLKPLPQFDEPMYDRDAFAAMKVKGMLHKTAEALANDPAERLHVRNYQTAMQEADLATSFILGSLTAA